MTLDDMKQVVINKAQEYAVKGNINDRPITVGWFGQSTKAGLAYVRKFHLEFNIDIMQDNWDEFEEVIAHEVAHLVVTKHYPSAKQAHGPEFRRVMQFFGFPGKTYHNLQVSKEVMQKGRHQRFAWECVECARVYNVSAKMHGWLITGKREGRCHCKGEIRAK